jgi:hypothetical protein
MSKRKARREVGAREFFEWQDFILGEEEWKRPRREDAYLARLTFLLDQLVYCVANLFNSDAEPYDKASGDFVIDFGGKARKKVAGAPSRPRLKPVEEWTPEERAEKARVSQAAWHAWLGIKE